MGRGGRGNCLTVGPKRVEVSRHSRSGDDLILGSADQQYRALVPSEDRAVGRESSEADR